MTVQQVSYRAGRGLIEAYTRVALQMDIEYHGALPAGPKIWAANHPTTTDPFFLMAVVSEQMSILVTDLAFEVPVFGDYLRTAQHIPVVAGQGRRAFEQARRKLATGHSIGIFPEGALSPLAGNPSVHKPRTGAVRLALSTGVPIIPVGIYMDPAQIHYSEIRAGDQSDIARWYLSGPYAVTVGREIHLGGTVDDRDYVRASSQYVMQQIAHLARQSDLRIREAAWAPSLWSRLLGHSRIPEQV
jgi:1-acyl-sn-glycerol-3-phosphate acyltransferase